MTTDEFIAATNPQPVREKLEAHKELVDKIPCLLESVEWISITKSKGVVQLNVKDNKNNIYHIKEVK